MSALDDKLAAFESRSAGAPPLPDPDLVRSLPVADRTVVPAGEGRAVEVPAGRCVAVVDLEGQQVADVWAYTRGRPREVLSAANTRTVHQRLFPGTGRPFVTDRLRPLLTIVLDESPGQHDMLCSACQQEAYAAVLGEVDHPSCESNFRLAAAAVGDAFERAPDPIDLFQHIPVVDGRLRFLPGATAPGDRVVFRAEADLVLVVSACPDDQSGANGDRCTAVAVDLLG